MPQGDIQTGDVQMREGHFALGRRSSTEMVAGQLHDVVDHPVVGAVLDAFGGQVLVLDRERRILAASPEFRDVFAACGVRASEGLGTCARAGACAHCGAVMAGLAAQCCVGTDHEECWIGIRHQQQRHSVELRAKATPLTLAGYDVMVLALQDIGEQKRRVVVEQSFLHDARNLLGSIIMWSEVLTNEPCEEAVTSIRKLALQLREQLNGHRLLTQAEKGDLVVSSTPLDLPALARALRDTFTGHSCGEGKSFVVKFPVDMPPPLSDPTLVLRILTNMVNNALEATHPGATVTVRFEQHGGVPTFTVHNPGAIALEIAARIFQRSFSTKTEAGHGLGTYSMRLYAEQYLGGQVAFTSSDESGTTFKLTLPAGQG
jgi:signal transduction histidine kinase